MHTQVKRILKYLMSDALNRTDIWDRLLRTWAWRHETIILTYHRVIEKWDRILDYSQPGMVVTAETFDRQLQSLKQNFEIVRLDSLIGYRSTGRPLVRPRCVITFDDGWRDNYEIAFPILRKHGLPATVFLTTDFIGTSHVFWHTELMYLLLHGELSNETRNRSLSKGLPASVRCHLMRLAKMTRPPCARDVNPVIEAVKKTCDQAMSHELVKDLAEKMGLRRPLFPNRRVFLDWDQTREMAAAGIEIGSHGCSHLILTQLEVHEAEEELVRSKAQIEASVGQVVQHFAFPDGAANSDLLTLARKAGYRTVCLCASGPDQGRSGPLALRRASMHEGISAGADGSFSKACLFFWLFRAPRMRMA